MILGAKKQLPSVTMVDPALTKAPPVDQRPIAGAHQTAGVSAGFVDLTAGVIDDHVWISRKS